MTTDINIAFAAMLAGIQTQPGETQAAATHRASISAKLTASFGMTHFFRTGSFGNGTNVSGYSDVDYFAVIPPQNLNNDSGQALTDVADALRVRFPNTGVRVNTPAVRVPFGVNGSETTEIVPVYATGTTALGFRSFNMPDSSGGWMFSAPESNDAYVQYADDRLSNQVKSLIRLAKAWKFWRGVPIKSFYLEMWIAHYSTTESAIWFPLDLQNTFTQLYQAGLPAIIDPRFPNDTEYLQAVNTAAQHAAAYKALGDSALWAMNAASYYGANQGRHAFAEWDRVFNGNFPAYV